MCHTLMCITLLNIIITIHYAVLFPSPWWFLFFRNLSCFSWFVVAVVVVVAVHVILSGTGWTLRVFPIM